MKGVILHCGHGTRLNKKVERTVTSIYECARRKKAIKLHIGDHSGVEV
jgi:dTDP-glucose pyrophosphorylase